MVSKELMVAFDARGFALAVWIRRGWASINFSDTWASTLVSLLAAAVQQGEWDEIP